MFKTLTLLKAIQLARAVYVSVSIDDGGRERWTRKSFWNDNVKITKKDARRVLSKYLEDKAPEYSPTWENEAGLTIATFSPESGTLHIGR